MRTSRRRLLSLMAAAAFGSAVALAFATGSPAGADPLSAAGLGLFSPRPDPFRNTPPDLTLEAGDRQTAEAYAQFAWALYLLQAPQAQPADALPHLKAAVSALPDSSFILGHLVSLLLDNGGHGAVAKELLPLARKHPESSQLNLVAAEALDSAERVEDAIDLLEACGEATDWQDPQVARRMAALYWKANRRADLQRFLKQLLRRPALRNTFDLRYIAAMVQRSMLEAESTEAEKKQALSEPERKRRRERMLRHARAAAKRVRDIESQRDLQQLADLLRDYEAWESLAAMLGRALSAPSMTTIPLQLLHAESLIRSGQREEGLTVLRQLAADPNLSPRALARSGGLFAAAGALDEAIAMYERLLPRENRPPSLLRGLASLYLQAKRPKDAVNLLTSLEKPGPETLFLLANAHQQQGEYQEAYATSRRLLEFRDKQNAFDWDSPQFFLFIATVAEESGHIDEALQWAERAREALPDKAATANFLGYLLADHNRQLSKAETLIRKALAEAPNNPAYLDSLAWVLYRQGNNHKALAEILHALRAQEGLQDAVILDHAGDIAAACGMTELAEAYWTEAAASKSARRNPSLLKAIRTKITNAP